MLLPLFCCYRKFFSFFLYHAHSFRYCIPQSRQSLWITLFTTLLTLLHRYKKNALFSAFNSYRIGCTTFSLTNTILNYSFYNYTKIHSTKMCPKMENCEEKQNQQRQIEEGERKKQKKITKQRMQGSSLTGKRNVVDQANELCIWCAVNHRRLHFAKTTKKQNKIKTRTRERKRNYHWEQNNQPFYLVFTHFYFQKTEQFILMGLINHHSIDLVQQSAISENEEHRIKSFVFVCPFFLSSLLALISPLLLLSLFSSFDKHSAAWLGSTGIVFSIGNSLKLFTL